MKLRFLGNNDEEVKQAMMLFEKNYSLKSEDMPVNVSKICPRVLYLSSPEGFDRLDNLSSGLISSINFEEGIVNVNINDWKYVIFSKPGSNGCRTLSQYLNIKYRAD